MIMIVIIIMIVIVTIIIIIHLKKIYKYRLIDKKCKKQIMFPKF